MKARKAIQIALRGMNEAGVGVLQNVLLARGVGVIGWRTFETTGDARVVVPLADAAGASSLLREMGVEFSTTTVVVARLGEPLAKYQLLTELRHAGIMVSWFYALAPLDRPTLVVFKTDNDERALQVFHRSPWQRQSPDGSGSERDGFADCLFRCERRAAA